MKEAGPPKRVVSKSVILGPGRNKGDNMDKRGITDPVESNGQRALWEWSD